MEGDQRKQALADHQAWLDDIHDQIKRWRYENGHTTTCNAMDVQTSMPAYRSYQFYLVSDLFQMEVPMEVGGRYDDENNVQLPAHFPPIITRQKAMECIDVTQYAPFKK